MPRWRHDRTGPGHHRQAFRGLRHDVELSRARICRSSRVAANRGPAGSAGPAGPRRRAAARRAVLPPAVLLRAARGVLAAGARHTAAAASARAPRRTRTTIGRLDRQGPRRRGRRRHARRGGPPSRPCRAGRDPAPRDTRRSGRGPGGCAGGRGMVAELAAGRSRRCNRAGRHRHRGRIHRRHRRDHHLRLGVGAGGPARGGRARRRWPDARQALGLRTSRPAGSGSADRARVRR